MRWRSKRRGRGSDSGVNAAIEGGIIMVSLVLYSFLILFCFIRTISFVNSPIKDRGGWAKDGDDAAAERISGNRRGHSRGGSGNREGGCLGIV